MRGVEVVLTSSRPGPVIVRAARVVRRAIAQLERELGPFPMRSMAVLLTGWRSGMEYYGATRTGIGALRHELGHMYFGTSAVNRTWRDTWLDEALVSWWEARGRLRPVPRDFRSALGLGRAVAAPGFDERAYGDGARVMERIAVELGGEDEMLAFLADLHQRRLHRPFTTDDFIDDVLAALPASSQIDRGRLEQWMLSRVGSR